MLHFILPWSLIQKFNIIEIFMLGVNRRRLYNRGNSNLKLDHRSLILVVVSSVVTFRKREKKFHYNFFALYANLLPQNNF